MSNQKKPTRNPYQKSYFRRQDWRLVITKEQVDQRTDLEGLAYPAILIILPENNNCKLTRASPKSPPPLGSAAVTIHHKQAPFFEISIALIPTTPLKKQIAEYCEQNCNITAYVEDPTAVAYSLSTALKANPYYETHQITKTRQLIIDVIKNSYVQQNQPSAHSGNEPNGLLRKLEEAAAKGVEPKRPAK